LIPIRSMNAMALSLPSGIASGGRGASYRVLRQDGISNSLQMAPVMRTITTRALLSSDASDVYRDRW
jgi:hypothetical protein